MINKACDTCKKKKTVLVPCIEKVKQNKDKTHPVFGTCDFYVYKVIR